MKRWGLFGMILLVLCGFVLVGFRTAIMPQKYTGAWYLAENGEQFTFSEGFILHGKGQDADHTYETTGAYIFCKDYMLLFSQSVKGLENVTRLYLVPGSRGDTLCEYADGNGKTYFFREPLEVLTNQ